MADANVELSDGTTTLEMTAHVTLEALQQALLDADPSYRIYLPEKTDECHENTASKTVVNNRTEIWRDCNMAHRFTTKCDANHTD